MSLPSIGTLCIWAGLVLFEIGSHSISVERGIIKDAGGGSDTSSLFSPSCEWSDTTGREGGFLKGADVVSCWSSISNPELL